MNPVVRAFANVEPEDCFGANTLYTFDLSKDKLVHIMPFVTDVTDLITTPDGAILLVTSKTKKTLETQCRA